MFVQGSNFQAMHPDYLANATKWTMIYDVLKGELAVKAKRDVYLPLPNMERKADASKYKERYQSYLDKAVFYNATARTLAGFVGQVFDKPPKIEIPDELHYLREDPSGSGVTLEQLAKSVLAGTVSYGRGGIFVDFPETGGKYTVKDVNDGLVRPTLTYYNTLDILNWRTTKRKAKTLLSLVVLREKIEVEDSNDIFVSQYQYRYRVLRLSNDKYTVTVHEPWRTQEPRTYTPQDKNGQPFDEIPFVFCGISRNDAQVDDAPLYDLAALNIAHYRNSADYEEACFMVGQPTVWYSGLDQDWIKSVLKNEFRLGSRGGLPLPAGGAAGLLQVASNTMCKEAMDQKEAQMVALGARIVRDPSVAKTATEVNSDKVTEISTLASGARNASAALRKAFEYAQRFIANTSKIVFELSTDFDMVRMTSQELLAIVTTWQAGLLATEEVRDIYTRAGYATLSMEDAAKKGVQKTPPAPVATEGPTAARTDNRSAPEGSGSV